MLVALRPGSLIPVPKEKMVKMTLQHGTSSITEEVELEWKYSGTPLDEYEDKNLHEENHFAITNLSLPIDTWEMERKFRCSGITRIAIPKDATMIMEKPFVAYYYPSAKGNLGYLRIPEYYPVNENTDEEEFELRYKQYQYAINMLEKNTVGLVIDQDHNCGGSVEYLEKMVGLFMDHPYAPQGFRFRASKRFFLDIEKWLKETDEHTLEHEELLIIQKDVKDAWERGDFLTTFTNFRGVTLLEPDHDVHYSKPILMLIDELSGSGGDAFPSLMQGYGRAKLFGTRTMGAGGNVTTEASLNYSGITLRMTRSLFYRPDGVEVENNGAVPNFNYTITRDDFVYQYLGYRAAYTQKLLEMLP